jgi:ribosome biogenesis GTPase / thiamine phosphate phosphatase
MSERHTVVCFARELFMIDSSTFLTLRRIGLLPAVIQQVLSLPMGDEPTALRRVTEVQREGLHLHDGMDEHEGRLLPALRSALAEEGDAVAVGDWVLARRNSFNEWWVHARVPPLNQLARRQLQGGDKLVRQVIVSNVDTALLVMGLDHDFNLRRLERYVTLARVAGVDAVVVLTKRDLCADAAARVAAAQALLPLQIGVVAVHALGDEPTHALAPWLLAGQTLVLLGSSGAGKSTLTNALTGQLSQNTGGNRLGDSRGRHTTTARSLHLTPQGACIIDTPGLRSLRLDGEEQAVGAVFDDITQLARQCRFRDCQHDTEPGCAVRDAVAPQRLRNYQKLLRESRRDSVTVLQRQTQVQQLKVRGRAVRAHMAQKHGLPTRRG